MKLGLPARECGGGGWRREEQKNTFYGAEKLLTSQLLCKLLLINLIGVKRVL
jgi:hypothetical protein